MGGGRVVGAYEKKKLDCTEHIMNYENNQRRAPWKWVDRSLILLLRRDPDWHPENYQSFTT